MFWSDDMIVNGYFHDDDARYELCREALSRLLGKRGEIVKDKLVNRVYYAACRDFDSGKTIALVTKSKWGHGNSFGDLFKYRIESETENPAPSDCPEEILETLTGTNYGPAVEWRRRCLAQAGGKS